MRVVIQRVKKAQVSSGGRIVGRIGQGLLVLAAIHNEDAPGIEKKMAEKLLKLRIFADAEKKMNLNLLDIKGEVLAVSQFTLYAGVKKGNRPGFTDSAPPGKALPIFNSFVEYIKERNVKIETGRFGQEMAVELVNDGPVTLIMDL